MERSFSLASDIHNLAHTNDTKSIEGWCCDVLYWHARLIEMLYDGESVYSKDVANAVWMRTNVMGCLKSAVRGN